MEISSVREQMEAEANQVAAMVREIEFVNSRLSEDERWEVIRALQDAASSEWYPSANDFDAALLAAARAK